MGKVYDIFDKFSIISIAIGFILGLYLAVNHNDSNLWLRAIPFILVFSLIMTLIPFISVGSFLIGNVIVDNGKLPNLLNFH